MRSSSFLFHFFSICSKTILIIFFPKYILSNIHATQSSANDFRLISILCRQGACENAWERKDLEFPSFFEFLQPRFRKSRLPFRINGSGDRWLSPFCRVILFWCLLWRTKLWESYIYICAMQSSTVVQSTHHSHFYQIYKGRPS